MTYAGSFGQLACVGGEWSGFAYENNPGASQVQGLLALQSNQAKPVKIGGQANYTGSCPLALRWYLFVRPTITFFQIYVSSWPVFFLFLLPLETSQGDFRGFPQLSFGSLKLHQSEIKQTDQDWSGQLGIQDCNFIRINQSKLSFSCLILLVQFMFSVNVSFLQ